MKFICNDCKTKFEDAITESTYLDLLEDVFCPECDSDDVDAIWEN